MKNRFYTPIAVLTSVFLLSVFSFSCKRDKTPTPLSPALTVTDADGNVYQTVVIGTQTWTTENLKTTKYNDGTPISNVTDGAVWNTLNTAAYCWYNNDIANKPTTGALYNYYVATDAKIAPVGWHVPTEAEWQTLVDYLGGDAIAGGKLKEVNGTSWLGPNTGATNESKFSARAGGRRTGIPFEFLGTKGFFWTSTNSGIYSLFNDQSALTTSQHPPQFGYSIRLIKD